MDVLAPFRIPLSTLKVDSASYDWKVDADFFAHFDHDHKPPAGEFQVTAQFERTGNVTEIEFRVEGRVDTLCDRCSAPIQMKVEGNYLMLVKFGDPEDSNDDVIVLDPDSPELNLGKTIYDFILVSIPMRHRIPDCETLADSPCDTTVLQYLQSTHTETGKDQDENPLWSDIKKAIDN